MKPTLLLTALATIGLLASPVAAKPKAKRSGSARVEKPVPQAAEIKALNLKQLAAMERGGGIAQGDVPK